MNEIKLEIKKLHENAIVPTKAHPTDLGYDLYALEDVFLRGQTFTKIRTGIAVNFPSGWGGFIKDRSSMASKGFYTVGGVIDEAYTGEISIIMVYCNPGDISKTIKINAGDKIAQLVPIPTTNWEIKVVDELPNKERGNKGFGSSGT